MKVSVNSELSDVWAENNGLSVVLSHNGLWNALKAEFGHETSMS